MRLPPLLALLALLAAQPSAALTRLGSLPQPADGRGVAVSGGRVYWIDSAGLHVADASDPRAPRELGALDTPGFPLDVEVAGDVAFVADDETLQIVDVSDPTAPRVLAAYAPPGDPEIADVEVVGTLAYLAVASFGLQIVDVTDPPPRSGSARSIRPACPGR